MSTTEETAERTALEGRLRFEELLAELSSAFVAARAEEIDGQIHVALRRVGEFLELDRAVIAEILDDVGARWRLTFWDGPGDNRDSNRVAVVEQELPWLAANSHRRRPLVIPRLDDLPAEAVNERRYCEMIGIRAFVMIPFDVGGSPVGNVFFDSFRERPWPRDLIRWMRRLAEVFANALTRRRAERQLQELQERLEAENVELRRDLGLRPGGEIVGKSEALRQVLRRVEQVAPTPSTVLILGETGTGKDLVARAIHGSSPRRDRPMLRINCAALPANLVEGELFGREKGAYTGAVSSQTGRFEAADGSTLFLDEIGELPLEVQAKLLRVLEAGELERLGSSRTRRVDVRLIAATNRDLEQAVADGAFRRDLYYRLAVFPITVPTLRQRRGDVELLVWAFVRELGESMGKTIEEIRDEDLEALERYPWPGNVRELRNLVERAMILSTTPTLRLEMPKRPAPGAPAASDLTFEAAQRRHLLEVLERCRWKVSGPGGAAEVLDLRPTTLETKMKKLGIRRPG